MNPTATSYRVDWVDAAKGLCILLVVMMHATLGVEKATGTETPLAGFIAWAQPFRMPDFFLISGLFLAARIDKPWPRYLDTKVVHFAYFYALWLSLQFLTKSPGMVAEHGIAGTLSNFAVAFVQPWGTLWFIYVLAIFFVTAKLLQALPQPAVLIAAALLNVLWPHTGWLLADEFAARFVFFYTGYCAAPLIFAAAAWVGNRPATAVAAALIAWAAINWLLVINGTAFMPGPNLIVSYAGIAAVIAFCVVTLPTLVGRAFTQLGRQSLAVYLAFPLFMGPARIVALKFDGLLPDWSVALISTAAGVIGPLVLAWTVSGTRLSFLFKRPDIARLTLPRRGSEATPYRQRFAKILADGTAKPLAEAVSPAAGPPTRL